MKHQTDKHNDHTHTNSAQQSDAAPSYKEAIWLGTGLLCLTLSIGGMLMISEDEPLHAKTAKPVDMQQVTQAFTPPLIEDPANSDEASILASATLVSFEQEVLASQDITSANEVNVYFGFDQSSLSEGAKISIQERFDDFKENQEWNITVQGHADQTGSDTYNQTLGLRRANAVKAYLTAQGIEESLIQTESLGSHVNVCAEDSEECSQKNRRAHIVVTPQQLSASVEEPLGTESVKTESEDLMPVESAMTDHPLLEEHAVNTTTLLSETVEVLHPIESTVVTESLY